MLRGKIMLSVVIASKIDNVRNSGFTSDSVKNTLNLGDYVIALMPSKYRSETRLSKVVDSNGLYFLKDVFSSTMITNSLVVSSQSYLFKVSKEDITDYKKYYYKLNEVYKKATSWEDWEIEDIESGKECREVAYRYENNTDSIRGLKTGDILGRDIKPGDLVYYASADGLSYGILISDTQVFTGGLQKKVVHHVFLQKYPNKEEIDARNKLQAYYLNSVKAAKKKSYKFGDVYTSSRYSYTYLGKIDINFDYLADSNLLIAFKADEGKEYWIRSLLNKPISFEEAIGNSSYLQSHIKESLEIVEVKDCYMRIKGHFIAKYRGINEFENLVNSIPAKSHYIGNLNIVDRNFIIDEFSHRTELKNFKVNLEIC